ncbi:hypothetical protein ACFVVC_02100 [Pseudarthrobacter sp. NPDC058196]|uniref:hypothetical protein n=1 Tax=Pseudarthrobacter sp. NPDC058196 TaxID=3346376 RepID=UPI0036D7D4F9
MNLHIDSLADLVHGAVSGADATREDFERALDQVFPRDQLDPLEGTGSEEYLVGWAIDQDAASPAEAARKVWREVFQRGPWQPGAHDGCIFTVSRDGRRVEIDLSDERFAHLFSD